jgi:hypothetical protein
VTSASQDPSMRDAAEAGVVAACTSGGTR